MSASTIQDLIKQVDSLSVEEKLRLLAYLAEATRLETNRPKWGDLYGIAPGLLDGEDAQEWVSRTRRESSEHREALLRR